MQGPTFQCPVLPSSDYCLFFIKLCLHGQLRFVTADNSLQNLSVFGQPASFAHSLFFVIGFHQNHSVHEQSVRLPRLAERVGRPRIFHRQIHVPLLIRPGWIIQPIQVLLDLQGGCEIDERNHSGQIIYQPFALLIKTYHIERILPKSVFRKDYPENPKNLANI